VQSGGEASGPGQAIEGGRASIKAIKAAPRRSSPPSPLRKAGLAFQVDAHWGRSIGCGRGKPAQTVDLFGYKQFVHFIMQHVWTRVYISYILVLVHKQVVRDLVQSSPLSWCADRLVCSLLTTCSYIH